MNDLIDTRVHKYLDALVPERHPELVAMEEQARIDSFPIIGPAAGQLCYLLTRTTGATRVFELGSGFGYSTAWFARGVRENGGGEVHHTVWDEELSTEARKRLAVLGLEDVVRYHVAEAVGALREQEGGFDIIFNDIHKESYPESLEVIEEKLRPGGLLIIDNMLWRGKIFDESDRGADTEGIREFTRRVTTDPRWIVSLIPIRDGVIVARRDGVG